MMSWRVRRRRSARSWFSKSSERYCNHILQAVGALLLKIKRTKLCKFLKFFEFYRLVKRLLLSYWKSVRGSIWVGLQPKCLHQSFAKIHQTFFRNYRLTFSVFAQLIQIFVEIFCSCLLYTVFLRKLSQRIFAKIFYIFCHQNTCFSTNNPFVSHVADMFCLFS